MIFNGVKLRFYVKSKTEESEENDNYDMVAERFLYEK